MLSHLVLQCVGLVILSAMTVPESAVMPPKGAKGDKSRQAAKHGPAQSIPKPSSFTKAKKTSLTDGAFKNPYEGSEPAVCGTCEQTTAEPERDSEDPVNNPQPLKWHKTKTVEILNKSVLQPYARECYC